MVTENTERRLLFIGDDKKTAKSLNANFKDQFNLISCAPKKFSLIEISEIKPDVILLSLNEDRNNNFMISSVIRTNCGLADVPLFFIFDTKNKKDAKLVFENGGVDFVPVPINFDELSARIDYRIEACKKHINLNEQIVKRDEFFSILSHDLRKPFASLMGITHLLSESAQFCTFEELRDLAKENYKTVTNTYHLLENLLEWCKVKCGQAEFKPTMFDMNNLVRRVVAHLKDYAGKKNISIEFNTSTQSTVCADERMIYTVLKNLIENALKFSEPDNKVVITQNETTDEATISIEDFGVGIKKDELNKLFNISNPYSTKGTHGERGSGLGLILSKELIHKNSGELRFKSKFGSGSKFSFVLPMHNTNQKLI